MWSNKLFQAGIVTAFIIGAFLIGTLWTKVQVLESQNAGAKVAGIVSSPAPQAPQGATAEVPKVTQRDHVRGNRQAKLALIEYSDLECPFCKSFHPTMQQVLQTYGDKVMWVYRHFPLSFHANAQKEAEAAECAYDQGTDTAFWKYIDAIYERTTSNGTGFALDKLVPLAGELGLDQTKFKQCLDSGKFTKYVTDDAAGGARAGVNGTPGNIVLNTASGQTQTIPGAVPLDQVKAVLDGMLK